MSGIAMEEIHGWLERGKLRGSTHVLVMQDTFANEYYPIFVSPTENAREVVEKIESDKRELADRVIEVYNLALPFVEQLNEKRARNF